MKKMTIGLILLNISLFAQTPAWFLEDNPYFFYWQPYIQFVDENTGWMICMGTPPKNDAIFKTTDGGKNWFCVSQMEIHERLFEIPFGFTSVDSGYYFARYSDLGPFSLLKTSDGGINWDIIFTFPNHRRPLNTFYMSGLNGWILLSRFSPYLVEVLRTYDGGFSWTTLDTLAYADYKYFQFFNYDVGLLLQNYLNTSTLLKTTNGGLNWNTISVWSTEVTSMKFKNEYTGYATYNGNLYYTHDGGLNWTQFDLTGFELYKVEITNGSFIVTTGYTFGPQYKGSLHVSNNAGLSWTTTEIDWFYPRYVSIRKEDEIFIPIHDSIVVATNLGTVIKKIPVGPTYNLEGVVASINSDPFAVGWKQDSLTNNFESAIITSPPLWRTKSVHPNMKFNCITEKNSSQIFIGGYEFTNGGRSIIMKCNEDGDSLQLVYNNNNQVINDLCFVNSEIGFAVGDNGLVLKTTDGGENWYQPQSFTNNNLNAVYFKTSLGFVGGANGLLAKTTDAGLNWSTISIGNSKEINSIFFSDSINIWIAGDEGLLMKSWDGGLSWIPAMIPTEFNLNYIMGIDPYITTAFGENVLSDTSVIYESRNGGISWYLITRIPHTKGINSAAKGSDTVWAVGNFGTIINSVLWYSPVELNSFNANFNNQKVQLSWSTASELNNQGFEIERSANKNDWIKIGFKEGKGTTTEQQNYSYTDDVNGINVPKLYYRLKQIDFDGSFEYSDVVEVDIAPIKFSLSQNYPNPFNPTTKISWRSPVSSHQTLKVYDILGREVATLVDEFRDAGSYEVEFRSAVVNKQMASGVYYYQVKVGEFVETKKMVLIK